MSSPSVSSHCRNARASLADAALQSRLLALGIEPAPMTTAEFGNFIANEIDKWAKVIKYADIRVN